MASRFEVRLSGSGGQGMILAGIILAEAAGIHEGKHVTQTESYGPEARGGSSRSDVVISDGEIDCPNATELDVLLALSQESYDAYRFDLKDDGILLIDEGHIVEDRHQRALRVPISKIAQDEVGKIQTTNIVALGVICGLTEVASLESLEKAVLNRVPKGTEGVNRKALMAGHEAGRRVMSQEREAVS